MAIRKINHSRRILSKERINVSKEALDDKTRIAEERIQTQRDIAALNSTRRS